MPVDRTRLKFREYDRFRKRAGLPKELVLYKYVGDDGGDLDYQPTETIYEGWCAKKFVSIALGQEFFEVEIAEGGILDVGSLFDGQVSHFQIGERFYKITGADGVIAPTEATRVWTIRCHPTGESRPS